MNEKDLNDKLEKLKDLKDIQCKQGNFDYDEYSRGMANGLILAISVFTGKEPKYIEAIKTIKEE